MVTVTDTNAEDVARVTREFLKPFDADEVKVKPAVVKGNRCLAIHYIDARCVMDRLDEVVGVNNWKDEYTVLPGGTEVECRLSVRIAGEWVTKADVGGESEQPDGGDRAKAAYSDALKRAAVKFGIGRYLYRIPQQWLDYDPVKKQVVRSPAQPQPKPQQQPVKPADRPDNLDLRAQAEEAYETVVTTKGVTEIDGMVKADIEAGNFSKADLDAIRDARARATARITKQPVGTN